MKRKTNIFYNTGPNALFLTFSNYTEALTGNFVSTNTKLFPSRFLCLNIPGICDEASKSRFIKDVLIARYENKLAFMRDFIIKEHQGLNKETYTIESEIPSLSWLIEAIDSAGYAFDIPYIGEISEQDWNGTYTDTILNIDASSFIPCEYVKVDSGRKTICPGDNSDGTLDFLYGWATVYDGVPRLEVNYEGLNITPIYDVDKSYYKDARIRRLNLGANDPNQTTLQFNVIIPLFDLINIDYKHNVYSLKEIDHINLTVDTKDENPPYIANVPLGIWFAPSPEYSVKLVRDLKTGFSQSWSLVIGSQFKPFPYMVDLPNEIDRDGMAAAYSTFAQVLSRQNGIIDKINGLTSSFTALLDRMNKLEKDFNSYIERDNNDVNSPNTLRQDFLTFKTEVNNSVQKLKETINANDLRWVNREG